MRSCKIKNFTLRKGMGFLTELDYRRAMALLTIFLYHLLVRSWEWLTNSTRAAIPPDRQVDDASIFNADKPYPCRIASHQH